MAQGATVTGRRPIVIEHPINDELQTGASRLLGGEMSIHAPYNRQ